MAGIGYLLIDKVKICPTGFKKSDFLEKFEKGQKEREEKENATDLKDLIQLLLSEEEK